jgi:hypothetical protein
LLANFNSSEELKKSENQSVYEKMAMYIGEVYVRNIPDGEWHIELSNKESYVYRLPSVIRRSYFPLGMSPFVVINYALYKKTGNYIRSQVENQKEYKYP